VDGDLLEALMSLPIRRFILPLRLTSLFLATLLGLPATSLADPHGWGRYREQHRARDGWQYGPAGHGFRTGAWQHDYDDDDDCDGPDEVVVYRRYYVPPARYGWRPVWGGYGRPARSGVDVDGTIVIRIGN